MSLENFEKLRQIVWRDLSLQKELCTITERQTFIARLVEIGAKHGLELNEEYISQTMHESRRMWIERWI